MTSTIILFAELEVIRKENQRCELTAFGSFLEKYRVTQFPTSYTRTKSIKL